MRGLGQAWCHPYQPSGWWVQGRCYRQKESQGTGTEVDATLPDFPESERGILAFFLMPTSSTEAACPLTAVRTSTLSSKEGMVPFDILFSFHLMLLHRSLCATHLPWMLLDFRGSSRKFRCLLAPSLPVKPTLTSNSSLHSTLPLRHAQGQA